MATTLLDRVCNDVASPHVTVSALERVEHISPLLLLLDDSIASSGPSGETLLNCTMPPVSKDILLDPGTEARSDYGVATKEFPSLAFLTLHSMLHYQRKIVSIAPKPYHHVSGLVGGATV